MVTAAQSNFILKRLLVCAGLLVPALASAVITNPTPQRSYVSLGGLDSNNCGPAAPCRTWQAALAQTQPGGEILTLDSGGFGTLNITQAVTLTIPAGVYGGMSPANGVSGITINAPGAVVQLLGVTINGQPGAVDGINVVAASQVIVERATIANTQVGVNFAASNGVLKMRSSTIKANSTAGLVASLSSGSGTVSLTSCVFQADGTGASSAAVSIGDNILFQSEGSSYGFNPGWGLMVSGSGTSGAVTNAVVSNNVFESNGSGGISVSEAGTTAAVYSGIEFNTFVGGGGTAMSLSGPINVDVTANSLYGFAVGIAVSGAVNANSDGGNLMGNTANALSGVTALVGTGLTFK